jgi:hypothetical protein
MVFYFERGDHKRGSSVASRRTNTRMQLGEQIYHFLFSQQKTCMGSGKSSLDNSSPVALPKMCALLCATGLED